MIKRDILDQTDQFLDTHIVPNIWNPQNLNKCQIGPVI